MKTRFISAFLSLLLSIQAFPGHSQDFIDYPLLSSITHVQPATGIVFWSANEQDLQQLGHVVQLEFAYLIPAQVVQTANSYDWSVVDELLEKAAANKRQCLLRFRYTYPGVTLPSVPQYIRDLNDYNDRVEEVEGVATYIPDWSNETLKTFTLDFFEAFALRYDNDPRLGLLQVGFGSYAEYHLYDGPFELGQTFPDQAFQETFLSHVDQLFEQTPWSISIDAANTQVGPFALNEALKALNFGLFDDSMMHENHSASDNEYNRSSWLFFGDDRFETNIAGGEFSYYTAYDQQHVLDVPDGPHGRSFETFAAQYHLSYIIGNDQLKYQSAGRIEEAARSMGYKFKVLAYRSNGVETQVEIANTGLAPIYYDAFPALDNVRSTTSLKGLPPGESRLFLIAAPAPDHTLHIVCNKILETQLIEFEASLDVQVGVADYQNRQGINFYPNPCNKILHLSRETDWALYNLTGQLLKTGRGSSIEMTEMSNGIYHLKTGLVNQLIYLEK